MTKETNYLFTISIVIPVFNSAKTVEKLMDEIFTALNDDNYVYETIFVNDSSSDNSSISLDNIYSKYQNINS